MSVIISTPVYPRSIISWFKRRYHEFQFNRQMRKLRYLDAQSRRRYPYQVPAKSPYRVEIQAAVTKAKRHLDLMEGLP